MKIHHRILNIILSLSFVSATTYCSNEFDNVQAVVLAAGKSKRFNCDTSKMLAGLQSKPLVVHALAPLVALHIPFIVVVGHQRELVMEAILDAGFSDAQFAVQAEQRGTGHAVQCAQQLFCKDHILITYGDMPLINTEIVEKLYKAHMQTNAELTLIVASNIDPACAYGRIVKKGNDIRIIEKKHFTGDINDFPLVNAGIYLVKRTFLESALLEIQENAATKEYYLTDILEIANKRNLRIETLEVPFDAVRGVNTQEEYAQLVKLVENLG